MENKINIDDPRLLDQPEQYSQHEGLQIFGIILICCTFAFVAAKLIF